MLQKHNRLPAMVMVCTSAGLILLIVCAFRYGSTTISWNTIFSYIASPMTGIEPQNFEQMMLSLRVPRVIMGAILGASLAIAGCLTQGLFRNPLADPAIIGVSSGETVAVALYITASPHLAALSYWVDPSYLLPLVASLGGVISVTLLYLLATHGGHTSLSMVLLAGIGLASLTSALTGFIAYTSTDEQLRDLTFWTLGSLSGATWTKIVILLPYFFVLLCLLPRLSTTLNTLAFGEINAYFSGLSVQRQKRFLILCAALAVGISVSTAGLIGFIGLVAPHCVRLAVGADYRKVLPISALLGACILIASDLIARTILAPMEIPVGIVTALLGSPLFITLIVSSKNMRYED